MLYLLIRSYHRCPSLLHERCLDAEELYWVDQHWYLTFPNRPMVILPAGFPSISMSKYT